jgi:ribosomal protein S27E
MGGLFKEKKKSNSEKHKNVIYTTLENKHNEKIKLIKEHKKLLPSKKLKLDQMKNDLHTLLSIKSDYLTEEQIERKLQINEEIIFLEQEIKSIEDDDQLKKYLLDTSHLLYMYFDEDTTDSLKTNRKSDSSSKQRKSVLDFFTQYQNKSTVPSNSAEAINNTNKNTTNSNNTNVNHPNASHPNTNDKNQKSNNSNPIEGYIVNMSYNSKGEIMENYLSLMDNNYVKQCYQTSSDEMYHCRNCNNEQRIFHSGYSIMICPSCGQEEKLLVETDTPSYKEPPREMTYFAYKKINHFNEWLSQFQAKESTDISDEIFEKIEAELKKERYLDIKNLTASKVRDILKKLNQTKYYEHCHYITNRITGRPAPEIDEELQEKLRNMFRQIQGPWMRHCPTDRSNFFSYPYIFYKFFQLLGRDEYLPNFRLLKSREKLQEHDIVWKKICDDLKWEFIKTV